MSKQKSLKRGAVFFVAALAVITAMVIYFKIPIIGLGSSWVQKENQTGPVIGNLGGVAVSIPKSFAHFVEYDDDPHFMEKKELLPPERTYESRLRSFGFEVRFPDMASEKSKTHAERLRTDINNSMWMRVGISAGEDYGSTGDEALERKRFRYLDPKRKHFIYAPLPDKAFGLTGYTPTDVDETLREHPRSGADRRDRNIYYYRDEIGQIITFIECSNMKHDAAPCQQFFNLTPTMNVHVRVSYRKGLLSHWNEIQSSISQVFFGFQVDSEI